MTTPSFPGKPPDIDKLDATSAVGPYGTKGEPAEGRFASYMQEPTATSPQAVTNPSPMQLQGVQAAGEPPTIAAIQGQMAATSSALGDVKNQLHTKGLKLKQSDKYSLRNKLADANTNIRNAAERLGVQVGPPPNLATRKNPVDKFLELVSDGQEQMNSAAQTLKNLDQSGKSINPGELLLIQIKLQKAQQELDFSSVILGKAVDSIKTLMNVQI